MWLWFSIVFCSMKYSRGRRCPGIGTLPLSKRGDDGLPVGIAHQ